MTILSQPPCVESLSQATRPAYEAELVSHPQGHPPGIATSIALQWTLATICKVTSIYDNHLIIKTHLNCAQVNTVWLCSNIFSKPFTIGDSDHLWGWDMFFSIKSMICVPLLSWNYCLQHYVIPNHIITANNYNYLNMETHLNLCWR